MFNVERNRYFINITCFVVFILIALSLIIAPVSAATNKFIISEGATFTISSNSADDGVILYLNKDMPLTARYMQEHKDFELIFKNKSICGSLQFTLSDGSMQPFVRAASNGGINQVMAISYDEYSFAYKQDLDLDAPLIFTNDDPFEENAVWEVESVKGLPSVFYKIVNGVTSATSYLFDVAGFAVDFVVSHPIALISVLLFVFGFFIMLFKSNIRGV
jgi:hypothetical protein